MLAYYNEYEPDTAQWLRNLSTRGLINSGHVDDRSIVDVHPDDLKDYTQCHFFAGVGVWSHALRLARFPDDRPVWTGSPPCQPFSLAGKQLGKDDPRHLAPTWLALIRERRPAVIFGEQVADAIKEGWLDDLFDALEGYGYACAATVLPACSVGAPHIRKRLFFGAYRLAQPLRPEWDGERLYGLGESDQTEGSRTAVKPAGHRDSHRLAESDSHGDRCSQSGSDRPACSAEAGNGSDIIGTRQSGGTGGAVSGGLAVASGSGRERREGTAAGRESDRQTAEREESLDGLFGGGEIDLIGLADPDQQRCEGQRLQHVSRSGNPEAGRGSETGGASDTDGERSQGVGANGDAKGRKRQNVRKAGLRDGTRAVEPTLPTDGFWRAVDWLGCRDDKWRPVRPSAQQMVDGSTASLGRLRTRDIRATEEAVERWAKRYKRDGTEAVRDLWDLLSQEEAGEREDGGFDSVQEAPFLLAFLRQLSDQRWKFPIGDERSSSEASRQAVRVLRYVEEPCYSSRGRGLDEQQTGEPSDPLRLLSQIVAYHTEICWGGSGWENVGSFPLAYGARSRVVRLRSYGNAIVAQVAQAFIEEFCAAAGIELRRPDLADDLI